MGIVDYAATTCLAVSGATLAAPFIEAKVPAVGGFIKAVSPYRKFFGMFGILGGALGFVLVPVLLLLAVGFGNLFQSIPILLLMLLELAGCVGAIVLGVMVLRSPVPEESHSGEIDMQTMLGLGGVAYGLSLMLLLAVARFIF